MNKSRGRRNQQPTGHGKRQSTMRGSGHELDKRSEVVQASRFHPELNISDTDDEMEATEPNRPNPQRPKAGR